MKKPWKVGPNQGKRQAYVVLDEDGRPIVRQSLTYEGRILHFDMTPEECIGLMRDLEDARMDIVSARSLGDPAYPNARF